MGSGVFVGYGWRMGELEGDKGVGLGGGRWRDNALCGTRGRCCGWG